MSAPAKRKAKVSAAPKSRRRPSASVLSRCHELHDLLDSQYDVLPETDRGCKEEARAICVLIERLTGRLQRVAEVDDTITEKAWRAFEGVVATYYEANVCAAEICGLEWGDYGVPEVIPTTVRVPEFVTEAELKRAAARAELEQKFAALSEKAEVTQ